jgi:DNA-binding transcriptional MerR regulator
MGAGVTTEGRPLYRIGEVATRAAVTTRTVRYYQEFGLLVPSGRSPGGTRRYSDGDVARLLRILELRNVMGLDLERIRVILQAEDRLAELRAEAERGISRVRRRQIVAEAVTLNGQMRRQVQDKLAVLQAFLAELDAAAARCAAIATELGMEVDETDPHVGGSAAAGVADTRGTDSLAVPGSAVAP